MFSTPLNVKDLKNLFKRTDVENTWEKNGGKDHASSEHL